MPPPALVRLVDPLPVLLFVQALEQLRPDDGVVGGAVLLDACLSRFVGQGVEVGDATLVEDLVDARLKWLADEFTTKIGNHGLGLTWNAAEVVL